MNHMANPIVNELKNLFQDCNINFLIGSGTSNPFFGTLQKIEEWLTDLDNDNELEEDQRKFLLSIFYYAYYNTAMRGNVDVLSFSETLLQNSSESGNEEQRTPSDLEKTYKSYKKFISTLNKIIHLRGSNTVSKQINLFTTNVDIFLEKIVEDLDLCFNDGFNGVFNLKYDLSNFRKSFYQKSPHYDNLSELPVYNIFKIHGSVTWENKNNLIYFNRLDTIKRINEIEGLESIPDLHNDRESTYENIKSRYLNNRTIQVPLNFIEEYESIPIVNPTKKKFRETTLNQTYYETLRVFANELEKENTILITFGFSFADEHLRSLVVRSLGSNPTCKLFICSYDHEAIDIKQNLAKEGVDVQNRPNVKLIAPEENFDLGKFNEKILDRIFKKINGQLK